MKQISKRLTYANVMSSIAVFLVLGGAAVAATQLPKNSVGTRQLKKNAVNTAKLKKEAVAAGKIKNAAVTTDKIADGSVSNGKLADDSVSSTKLQSNSVIAGKIADSAVTNGKLANDAVGTTKIAGSAVTAEKLAAGERSEAIQVWQEGLLNTEMATGLLGNYASGTLAASAALPAGNYVVTASTELINSAIAERSAICRLFDDGSELGEGSAVIGQLIIVTQGTVTITGISDGGNLSLRCRASSDKVFSFNRKITAIRVGSVG